MQKNRHYLVIDLEATCSDDGSLRREEMEIIEIGAVMLSPPIEHESGSAACGTESPLADTDEFQTFIKPVRHTQLTDFCKALTSISQADVERAPAYPQAIASLQQWITQLTHGADVLFCSWGAYDKKQFKQDCAWHQVPYPFSEAHCNVKQAFARATETKPKGLGKAVRSLGWTFSGTPHRGIDDARNIARILKWLLHRQAEL